MTEEQSPFAKAGPSDAYRAEQQAAPVYGDESPKQQLAERGLFVAAKVNVLITLGLCIGRSVARPVNAGLYMMYALSLALLVGVELYTVQLYRLGDIGTNRRWFLYMFVIFVLAECICTDIAIFQ